MAELLAFAAPAAPATLPERLAALAAARGLTEVEAFLRAAGPVPVPARLPALAAALRLAPVEADLLVLAGLAEAHEGYAGAFRRLGPAGEPFPTVGLAAQLLCESEGERQALRGLLETGGAVAAGALAAPGPLPFFERPLLLGA